MSSALWSHQEPMFPPACGSVIPCCNLGHSHIWVPVWEGRRKHGENTPAALRILAHKGDISLLLIFHWWQRIFIVSANCKKDWKCSAQLGCHVPTYHSITVQKGNTGFWWTVSISITTLASVTLFWLLSSFISSLHVGEWLPWLQMSYPHTLLFSYLLLHYKLPSKFSSLNKKLTSEDGRAESDISEPLNELILLQNI